MIAMMFAWSLLGNTGSLFFNLLEDSNNVTIANPKLVRAIRVNKDDTKDSKWIGHLVRLGLIPNSFIPPKPLRVIREYTRYIYKLTSCKTSEKNPFLFLNPLKDTKLLKSRKYGCSPFAPTLILSRDKYAL